MTIYTTRSPVTTNYSSRTDKFYLMTEDGKYLTTEDGKLLITEESYNIATQYTTRPIIT